MRSISRRFQPRLWLIIIVATTSGVLAEESNELAPEVTDLKRRMGPHPR